MTEEIKRKLETTLSHNNIFYDVYNNGIHYKVMDLNGDYWNFYPSTQKYFRDSDKKSGKGLFNFLSELGVQKEETCTISVTIYGGYEPHHLSNKQYWFDEDVTMLIPFNLSFNIVPPPEKIIKKSNGFEIHVKRESVFMPSELVSFGNTISGGITVDIDL